MWGYLLSLVEILNIYVRRTGSGINFRHSSYRKIALISSILKMVRDALLMSSVQGCADFSWQLRRVETSAGRKMCSLAQPSTVNNLPGMHSPLSSSSITHLSHTIVFLSSTHASQPVYFSTCSPSFITTLVGLSINSPIYVNFLHSLSNVHSL